MHRSSLFVVCALITAMTGVAHAQSCAAEIQRLELAASGSGGRIAPTAPQSVAAQLSRQPTPASVAQAERQAHSRFASVLDQARAQDARGDTAACLDTVAKARQFLEPN
jgi:hypothetical protein